MQTMTLGQVLTRSIPVRVQPASAHAYLADPQNLPEWAPAFAQAVRADGDEWLVTSGDAELRMSIPVAHEQLTVDMVAAADKRFGLFMRVLPNGDGSECQLTFSFPPGTPQDVVDEQMTVIATELAAIRDTLEARTTA